LVAGLSLGIMGPMGIGACASGSSSGDSSANSGADSAADSAASQPDATTSAPDGTVAEATVHSVEAASDSLEASSDAGCVYDGAPLLNPAQLTACDSGNCINAHCVQTGALPDGSASSFADCDMTHKCVPDNFIVTNGKFILSTCQSVGGAEGRCLSTCLPNIQAKAATLPKTGCAPGEVCAPCFDPVSGASTGTCTLSCDPGPTKPPFTFPKCCSDAGTCIPSSSLPDAQASTLGTDTCPSGTNGYLCSPNDFIGGDGGYVPPTCDSIGGGEGRCLSTCLPSIGSQASKLPQSSCAAGHVCAPCYDPVTGADTNACRTGADKPQKPPFTFPSCCGDAGMCLPSASVPDAQASTLGANTCPSDMNNYLCAPNEYTAHADGGFVPPTCASIAGGEGRCLSICLPSIGSQASKLPDAGCTPGDLCAPCYDPITGTDTNACHISNDPGPKQPAFTFPSCCTNRGVCVPTSLVPSSQQSQLGMDSCPNNSNNYLCVAPRAFAVDAGYMPPSCTGLLLGVTPYTGVCLPDCLPSLSGTQGQLLSQGSCTQSGDKCAPCTDPLTGQSTGACN
jgi:hypothetical protein